MNFLNLGQGHILNLNAVACVYFHVYDPKNFNEIPEEHATIPLPKEGVFQVAIREVGGNAYFIVDQQKVRKLAEYFS